MRYMIIVKGSENFAASGPPPQMEIVNQALPKCGHLILSGRGTRGSDQRRA